MVKMILNRRQALKRIAVGATGAAAGYGVAKGMTYAVGAGLEASIGQLADFQLDLLHELTGSIERKLGENVKEVEHYFGESEKEFDAVSKYWDRLGLIGQERFYQLKESLEKAESYVKEASLSERLVRFKNRLERAALNYDNTVESFYPKPLRKFNEWFSKLVKGEERGSRAAGEEARKRLDALVSIYDSNRDTMIAQSHLIKETAKTFSAAQQEVVKHIDNYLQSGKIKDAEEREFYSGLKELALEDVSGKKLADYLLGTGNYYSSLEAAKELERLNSTLENIVDELSSIQALADEGIKIKDELRKKEKSDLGRLSGKAKEFYELVEQKKNDLIEKGFEINYKASRLEALKEAISENIRTIGHYVSISGGIIGGTIGLYIGHKLFKTRKH